MTVGGLSSTLLGGFLSDLLANPKNTSLRPRARAWIPAIGSGAFVCWIRVGGLTSEYGLISLGRIPLRGVLVRTHSRRGVAQGLFSLTTALGNFGPVIVGSDGRAHGPERYLLQEDPLHGKLVPPKINANISAVSNIEHQPDELEVNAVFIKNYERE
eukprot:gene31220-40584_t